MSILARYGYDWEEMFGRPMVRRADNIVVIAVRTLLVTNANQHGKDDDDNFTTYGYAGYENKPHVSCVRNVHNGVSSR